ncbi:type II toxin-antitoxin system toxin DNA ADP-ribosyl transferase DarT [Nostoc sp.]|uniref:type II toxin-antitoxin system toxin DNA ADP-ribosyl transferase DarT n=1 Tax=Nostoc sp. TaxID=1180 RepID=UPI002FF8ADE3
MPTPIYHITHINNLPSILKSGGLMANSRLRKETIKYLDIAYGHIQDRRGMTRVPCGAGGSLHDYVPFYFAPRSPMLYANHKKSVDKYSGGQTPILHLVSSAEVVDAAGLSFVGTDGHAAMEYTAFFDELEYLYADELIDWEIMEATYWADTEEDGDRKRRRQAEFLVHQFFPWQLIQEIGVINTTIQTQVREMLYKINIQTPIKVCSKWYY